MSIIFIIKSSLPKLHHGLILPVLDCETSSLLFHVNDFSAKTSIRRSFAHLSAAVSPWDGCRNSDDLQCTNTAHPEPTQNVKTPETPARVGCESASSSKSEEKVWILMKQYFGDTDRFFLLFRLQMDFAIEQEFILFGDTNALLLMSIVLLWWFL